MHATHYSRRARGQAAEPGLCSSAKGVTNYDDRNTLSGRAGVAVRYLVPLGIDLCVRFFFAPNQRRSSVECKCFHAAHTEWGLDGDDYTLSVDFKYFLLCQLLGYIITAFDLQLQLNWRWLLKGMQCSFLQALTQTVRLRIERRHYRLFTSCLSTPLSFCITLPNLKPPTFCFCKYN